MTTRQPVVIRVDPERVSVPCEIDGKRQLQAILPGWAARVIDEYEPTLEELALDVGRNAIISEGGRQHELSVGLRDNELQKAVLDLRRFGSDNRKGIPGTLHRISAVRHTDDTITGLTIRVARAVSGLETAFDDVTRENKGMLIIGPPRTGKTTLTRCLISSLASHFGVRVWYVDTSMEMGGPDPVPHPITGRARRMPVQDPSRQYLKLLETVKNHSPVHLIADEMKTREDIEALMSIGRSGVAVTVTTHAESLEEAFYDPNTRPVFGVFTRGVWVPPPLFQAAVVINSKLEYWYYPDLKTVSLELQGAG
jgi:stage III sporulation protein SpoIIIAA